MNLQEQLRQFRQKRNEADERQKSLMETAGDEGRTLDADETSEYDGLETEIKHIDQHVKRLEKMVERETPSTDPDNKKPGGPTIIVRKTDVEDQFKGQAFVRRVICRTLAQLGGYEETASQIAEKRYGKTNPQLVRVIKAGVAGGSATGAGSDSWGAELVDADARYMGDFIEFLAGMTVYDRLPLREVPANIRIKGQDGIGTGFWVGESKAIPASAMDFSAVDLDPLKVAALTVVSKELLRDSSPAAEALVRDALGEASAQRIDTTFLSTDAAVAGVSPAGILNGVAGKTSSGIDSAGVRDDIAAMYGDFLTAKNASGLQLVSTPSLAKAISLQTNALGQTEFEGLGADGGTLLGDPLVTGDNVGATHFILLKPSDIWRIGDTGVEVSLSMDATIEQDDAPTGDAEAPTAASANLVSMFQTENVAFKVVRSINFAKRRAHAAQFVSDAAYTASGS